MTKIGQRFLKCLTAALAVALFAPTVFAVDWPSKPVRLIVPYPPGGVGDMATRAFAARLGPVIGQPVNVENMPGGTQIIGVQAATRAEPDGHTLVLVSPTSLVLNPALKLSLPYDPDRLSLVTRLFSSPLFVIVSPKVPATNLAELISYAKTNPGKLNYGSTGERSATHLITEHFSQVTGIRMTHVPYKGGTGLNVDLITGELHVYFDPGAASLPLVRDGRLNALGVTGSQRSRSLPSAPTVREAGVPYEVMSWWGLAGPEGLSPALTRQIAAAAGKALEDPSLAEQSLKLGIDYGTSSPEAFTDFVRKERALWGGVIQTLNLKPE